MKKLFLIVVLCLTLDNSARAHDEGHGAKTSDAGKYGGLVSGVILKSDASLGETAKLLYKAELVRSNDGTVRVYVYDQNMKSQDSKAFDTKASAIVSVKSKGKWKDTPFELAIKDGVFLGKMPKPASKPYNIEVVLKHDDKELLSAFHNLD